MSLRDQSSYTTNVHTYVPLSSFVPVWAASPLLHDEYVPTIIESIVVDYSGMYIKTTEAYLAEYFDHIYCLRIHVAMYYF